MVDEGEIQQLIKGLFISEESLETSRALLSQALEMGLGFKVQGAEGLVVRYREQEAIMQELLEPLPTHGKSLEDVLEEFKGKVLSGSVNFSSPNFMAFPDCGNSLPGMLAHVLYGFLNQNLINSIHTSPTATFVEMATINWLREVVGYKVEANPKDILDVGGINVTGGVSANAVGLLLAREHKMPGTLQEGLSYDPKRIKVFMPRGIGHYSIKASLGWMGIGINNVVEVDTTHDFVIDQRDLLKKIRGCEKDDLLTALVVYTGDSRTMAIDDLPNLAQIAHDHGMWFHVDACHGLSLCFSDKLREKVRGIEEADSVTVDPHKVLFVPYTLSYVLTKDPHSFERVIGISDLITKEPFSFGQITPFFGSRAFNSLKLWFLIKSLGREGIGKLIEYRHEMVKYFSEAIASVQDFYTMNEVTINSAVFMYVPPSLKGRLDRGDLSAVPEVNALNKEIQLRTFKEGKYYVHTFQLNDFRNVLGTGRDTVFQMQRLMLGNPLTNRTVLDDYIRYVNEVSKDEARRKGYL